MIPWSGRILKVEALISPPLVRAGDHRPYLRRSRSFALLAPVFFAFLSALAAELLARQRNLGGDLAAGPADAVLEPAQFAVDRVADREEVGDPDDVVELVRVAVDVVELLLAVGPGDVLVGAEADSLVVLGRGEDRRPRFAAARRRASPVLPLPPGRPPSPSPLVEISPFASTSLVSTNDSKRIGRRVRRDGSLQEGDQRAAVDALVGFGSGQFEHRRGDVDVRRQLARSSAFGLDPRAPGSGAAGASPARRRGTCRRSGGARRRRSRCRRRR